MLKTILLAGSMMVAVPALAQTTTATDQTQAGRTPITENPATTPATLTTQQAPTASTAPTGDAMTAQTSTATSAPTTPADPVVAQQPASPASPAGTAAAQTTESAAATPTAEPGSTAPAQTAETGATPANQPTQVATIVDKEFPAYDKDTSGSLSETEFGTWMVALKKQSDPATVADSPETKKWVGAAFAQADADKSAGLTKVELTGFLSQGQS